MTAQVNVKRMLTIVALLLLSGCAGGRLSRAELISRASGHLSPHVREQYPNPTTVEEWYDAGCWEVRFADEATNDYIGVVIDADGELVTVNFASCGH